jgi:glycosyltransferase involved in cell wall biosynthesis
MVAVEAAACGALPISAAHSGLAEVSRVLGRSLPDRERELISFPLERDVVRSIATRLIDYLSAPPDQREATIAALVQTVTDRYSWEGVARGALDAAGGELDKLESPLPPPASHRLASRAP